jgi:hypothetical protein
LPFDERPRARVWQDPAAHGGVLLAGGRRRDASVNAALLTCQCGTRRADVDFHVLTALGNGAGEILRLHLSDPSTITGGAGAEMLPIHKRHPVLRRHGRPVEYEPASREDHVDVRLAVLHANWFADRPARAGRGGHLHPQVIAAAARSLIDPDVVVVFPLSIEPPLTRMGASSSAALTLCQTNATTAIMMTVAPTYSVFRIDPPLLPTVVSVP